MALRKTTTLKRSTATKPKKGLVGHGSYAMSTAIRFAEKQRGKIVGRVQGKRFKGMLRSAPLEIEEWANAVYISPRTLQERIREDKSFDELQSDRIVLIMQVMDRGKEVFGDAKTFRRWLDEPRPVLGDRKPINMLGDLVGIGEVLAELGRIEHGVF